MEGKRVRRKENKSETHETKRYYEVPPEKVQEWSDTIADLTEQNQQFKAERDTLIADIEVLRAKVSSLEKIRAFKDSALKGADIKIKTLEQENEEVYHKAQAFDNYIADLAKTMEEFPHDYDKYNNFAKETYEFYMKNKEDFIKAYEKEVGRKHELIRDVSEYDELIKQMEVNDEND